MNSPEVSLNYVGNISVLDRGDAPAQAVLDRNARSLAQRIVDETRDELNKVMSRVHTIFGSMDTVEDAQPNPNMEYLSDLAELETLLKDEIRKRQYQQQVTVFIVGYQDVCHQKLKLIQQVNEFFMDNVKSVEEEEWFPTTPDIDLDEMSSAMEDSLNHAHELTDKLAELNKEMMDYMLALADKKASSRGRKKIEKSLQQAKEEVTSLREKLLLLQNELQEREDKVQSLFKQLDVKNLDAQKFRTAAELGKQKLILAQKEMDELKAANEESKKAFAKLLDSQIQTLQERHRQEVEEVKQQYETKLGLLQDMSMEAISEAQIPNQIPAPCQNVSPHPAKQETSPPSRTAKVSGKSVDKRQTSKSPVSTKAEMTVSSKFHGQSNVAKSGTEKETAEIGSQDDTSEVSPDRKGQFPASRSRQQAKATPQSLLEADIDSDVDLFDENVWTSVPDDQLKATFSHYRQLSTNRLKDLEEKLQLTVAKTQRKLASLKAQFQEHKSKWDKDRKLLLEQMDKSFLLQINAGIEANRETNPDTVQLESLTVDQQTPEQEQVQEPEKADPSTDGTCTNLETSPQSPSEQPTVPKTPVETRMKTSSADSEQDLQTLMQQTDDAKVQELNARMGASVPETPEVVKASSSLQTTELKLEEGRHAAESGQSTSPGIHLPRHNTNFGHDELILNDDDDENDGDEADNEMDDNFEDDITVSNDISDFRKLPSMHDVGTSPLPGTRSVSRETTSLARTPSHLSRSSTNLLEESLLKEYLEAYESVVRFKEAVARMFLEKDLMSAYQMTTDLKTLNFDHSKKILPQIEELTKNIIFVLDEVGNVINSHLVYDREPQVSSLNVYSREPTAKWPSDSFTGHSLAPHGTKSSGESVASCHQSGVQSRRSSMASDKQLIHELQDQYNLLKEQLNQDGINHREQIERNSAVMQEMQETINELQTQLFSMGKPEALPQSLLPEHCDEAVLEQSPSPDTAVLFTRLDSERNAKIMKKAVMEEKLDPEKYKEAVSKMDEYVSLPARRLGNLVRKYVHHRRMREAEEKVKKSASMTEEVLRALDKMEHLQNQRTRQWTQRMNGMGAERLKLANLLMDTLDTIEQESGVFLIKPMYSYRGRDVKPDHGYKLSRPIRHRHRRTAPCSEAAASLVPAPTPSSNCRLVRSEDDLPQMHAQMPAIGNDVIIPGEINHGEVKVSGSHVSLNSGQPGSTWNAQMSHPWNDQQPNVFHTPRILELDINRMLIGQNNVSSKLPFQPTDDRLVNANQNTLRSYITVQRPSSYMGADRPTSAGSGKSASPKLGVSQVDKDIPVSISSPQPLPPISCNQEEGKERERTRPSSVTSGYKDKELPRKPAGVFHVPA